MQQLFENLKSVMGRMLVVLFGISAGAYFLTLVIICAAFFNWLESDLLYVLIIWLGCTFNLIVLDISFETKRYKDQEQRLISIVQLAIRAIVLGMALVFTYWYGQPFNLEQFNLRCVITGVALAGLGICLYGPLKRILLNRR